MNILIVASPVVTLRRPFKGGTESFIVRLANRLTEMGHTVDVLALDADETDNFQTLLLEESPFSMKDAIHSEEWGQKIYKAMQFSLMSMSQYDVIHFNSYLPLLYDLAAMRKIPSVVTLHTPVDNRFSLLHKLHSRRDRDVRYVAVSERLKLDWEANISTAITVIPNGIDPIDQNFSEEKRDGLIWVGRLCEEKNPIDAIKLARLTNEKLTLFGPIDQQKYFDQKIKPELDDQISYRGHVSCEELYSELGKSRFMIASALWQEPFGLSILEALSAGTSIIGYASAVPPELRHKDCVSIASKQCVHELCRRYQEIRCRLDTAANSAELAKEHASKFSLNDTAERYIKIYHDVTEKRNNPNNNILRPSSWQRTPSTVSPLGRSS